MNRRGAIAYESDGRESILVAIGTIDGVNLAGGPRGLDLAPDQARKLAKELVAAAEKCEDLARQADLEQSDPPPGIGVPVKESTR